MSDVEGRLRALIGDLERAQIVPRGMVPDGELHDVKIATVALDSLSRMTLLQELEARFDIVVPEIELPSVRTFGDLISLVVRLSGT
jgi:acyl carrier protein